MPSKCIFYKNNYYLIIKLKQLKQFILGKISVQNTIFLPKIMRKSNFTKGYIYFNLKNFHKNLDKQNRNAMRRASFCIRFVRKT